MPLSLKSKNATLFILAMILISFAYQNKIGLILSNILSIIYIALASKTLFTPNRLLTTILFGLAVQPAFLAMNHGASHYYHFFSTLIVFFLAEVISKHPIAILHQAYKKIFYAYIAFALIGYYIYKESPQPFSEIINNSSTNGIPAYLIIIQISLSLTSFMAEKKLPLISPIWTLIIAVLGLGRASIISALLILLFSIFFNMINAIKYKKPFYRRNYFAEFIFIFFLMFLLYQAFDYLSSNTRLAIGYTDSARLTILHDYLRKIDFFTFFTGASYDATAIEEYMGNPHISLIRTHAYFGIGGLIIILLLPFSVFLNKRKDALSKIVFFSFIMIWLVRGLTDSMLFPTLLDFFLFYTLFLLRHHPPSYQGKGSKN